MDYEGSERFRVWLGLKKKSTAGLDKWLAEGRHTK